ncbi:response regulator receiver protein [Streptomyces sp. WAC 01529]|uniref:GAF and ANTAR domain-containing protein n=1 Tax=Streptomyces sp. WAC 01529 TaxID=2203205 RepID=UPI000F707101|nr:GAF and ANTAR domain-containing protein [Streptomyces sp. WAC 01529]AZM53448.1 response regulator receiver protein [Streptomyces sp. WAC 01529]
MGDHPCALRLAEVLVEAADTLTDDFDPERYLRRVSDRSVELLDAQGAGVLYAGGGDGVRFIPGSRQQEVVRALLAVQLRGGPCLDSFGTGKPVPPIRVDSNVVGARWPAFAERAGEHGVAQTFAVPLRHGGTTLGVLNVFVSHAHQKAPSERELRIAQVLADAAAVGLVNHRTHARALTLTQQLQGALDSRIRIEQAKGMLAERWNTGMDEAFEALRRYARRERQVIDLVAVQVIKRTLTGELLRKDRSAP